MPLYYILMKKSGDEAAVKGSPVIFFQNILYFDNF